MREVNVKEVEDAISNLCIEANYYLGSDIKDALDKAKDNEPYAIAKDVLDKIIINSKIASDEHMPMCQDTGMACVFLEIGQDVHFVGGLLEDSINQGVRRGYADGYLRK